MHIALQLASALNVVHGFKICHNDMKPRNFLYFHDAVAPKVTLLDFDLATRFDDVASSEATAVGTIEYMSPEQTGQLALPRDYRTDLYSLGVILYHFCTGNLPYSGASMTVQFHAIISALPSPPVVVNPAVPEMLSGIIMTLLNKSPDMRYQSAFALMHDLQRCLTDWTAKGAIDAFILRECDCPVMFRIPQGLFGREAELQLLNCIYERTRTDRSPHNLLLGGPAGIGKSSLLSTLHQSDHDGIYLVGKYEAIKGETPYYAFEQAIAMLVRHLLLLPQAEVCLV